MTANLEEIQQQTPEWLEMRREKIGASDAPVIMGVSPWKSPYELWVEKMGLSETTYRSPAMQRGIDLEDTARIEFELTVRIKVYPKVVTNPNFNWQMASLDGISDDGKTLVEIKCPGDEDHQLARQGVIPEKYIPQLQHQMCVCGLNEMYYFSFKGITYPNFAIKIKRDDEYINKLIEKETEFWQCMQTFTPPTLTERDYTKRTDLEWKNTAYEWTTAQRLLKECERKENELRKRLIALSDGKNSVGSGLKVSKVIRKGTIDYAKIPYQVNVEEYRNESIQYWKVSEDKN